MKAGKSIFIITALLLGVMLTFSGCAEVVVFNTDNNAAPEEQTLPRPLLYEKDGKVVMACGTSTTTVGTTDELYNYGALNAAFSKDNSSLFYIRYGGQKNSGTLMKLNTGLPGAPQQIAEGVCAAQVSSDGKAVLFITGITDLTGDLYLKSADAAPQLVANNVLPVCYGFSQQGGTIYYFVLEGSDTLALYVKKGSDAPALVAKHNETPYIQFGVCLDYVGDIVADEQGRLLYSFSDDYSTELSLYSNGADETISKQGTIIKTFGGLDELLYTESDNFTGAASLWYKNKGAEAKKIADNAYIIFAGEDSFDGIEDINGSGNDRQFVLSELAGDFTNSVVTLYEQALGGEKQEIAKSDGYMSVMLSPAKNSIVYGRGAKSYIARKISGRWVESKLTDSQDISYFSAFDASGQYFYYINSGENYYGGTLCRYSVTDGKTDKLGENINTISLCGGAMYAVDGNGTAYRLDGSGMTKIGQNVGFITQATGGVFLESYTEGSDIGDGDSYIFDIQYVADGQNSAQSICSGALELFPYSIEYYPPIEKDPYRALEMLISSAYYYQAQLDGEDYEEQPAVELQKAIELSELFSQTNSDVDYTGTILALLNEGFENYQLWQNEAPGDKKELYRVTALLKLGDAIDEYEASDGGDEEGE